MPIKTNPIKANFKRGTYLLTGGQCMVTIKLWYWIMNNKLNVLREMKQLQLQIAELAGRNEPSAN